MVEKPLPGGKKKRIRRRILEDRVYLVPSNKEDDGESKKGKDDPVTYEFVPIDEHSPEDDKYNPDVSICSGQQILF